MNSFLMFLGGTLLCALIALFAVPQFIDWNSYRSTFERHASQLVGREVRVGGNVNLRLLPAPYLSFENIRIADQSGRFDTPLVKMDAYTVWLSVPPLLQGTIEARKMEFTRPRIRLYFDEQGHGNWRGIGSGDLELPFAPKQVTLKSVEIQDGQLELYSADRERLLKVEKITGSLSAPSLQGPYKFRGVMARSGIVHEIKLLTAPPDEDGNLRLTASTNSPETGARIAFDGQLLDIAGASRIDGQIGGRIEGFGQSSGPAGPAMEWKTRIQGSGALFTFSDLSVIFESAGRPQLFTGNGRIGWQNGVNITSILNARWLDLDNLVPKLATPFETVSALLARAQVLLPAGADVDALLTIDQANLGGGLVTDIQSHFLRQAGQARIERLSARLPGTGSIMLSGALSGLSPSADKQDAFGFDGMVSLKGRNLHRFMAWAWPGVKMLQSGGEKIFALRSNLRLAGGVLNLSQARGEIAATAFAGEMVYRTGETKTLSLDLTSQNLDLRDVVTGNMSAEILYESLRQPKKIATDLLSPLFSGIDLHAVARIGRLKLNGTSFHDLALDIEVGRDGLIVRELEFSTDSGLALEASGAISPGNDHPRGTLRYVMEGRTVQAVGIISDSLRPVNTQLADRIATSNLAPLRLAGLLAIGERGRGSLDFTADGSAGDSRARVLVRMDGHQRDNSPGLLDVTAEMSNDRGAVLLRQILNNARKFGGAGPGTLTMRARGQYGQMLSTSLTLRSGGVNVGFAGKLNTASDALAWDGKLNVRSSDHTTALAFLTGHRLVDEPMALRLESQLKFTGGAYRFDDAMLNIGASEIIASGTAAPLDTGYKIAISANVTTLDVGTIAGFNLAPAGSRDSSQDDDIPASDNGDATSTATANGNGSIWPDRKFDLAWLDGLTGEIELTAETLVLAPGLEGQNGRMTLHLAPGVVSVTGLTATLADGQLKASANLGQAAAGVELALQLQLSNADLSRWTSQQGQPFAYGRYDLTLALSGRGLSPRGLVTVAKGQGRLSLRDASVARFSPIVVQASARFVLERYKKLNLRRLRRAIRAMLGERPFAIGQLEMPLEIEDGVISARPVELQNDTSQLKVTNYLHLTGMRVDSEWQVKPRGNEGFPLPHITVLYTGPAADLLDTEPSIDAENLHRELLVRQLEGDVEKLEELRLLEENTAEPVPVPEEENVDRSSLPELPATSPEIVTGNLPVLKPQKPRRKKRVQKKPDDDWKAVLVPN